MTNQGPRNRFDEKTKESGGLDCPLSETIPMRIGKRSGSTAGKRPHYRKRKVGEARTEHALTLLADTNDKVDGVRIVKTPKCNSSHTET